MDILKRKGKLNILHFIWLAENNYSCELIENRIGSAKKTDLDKDEISNCCIISMGSVKITKTNPSDFRIIVGKTSKNHFIDRFEVTDLYKCKRR